MYDLLLVTPLKRLISMNAVKRTPHKLRVSTTWWLIHSCLEVGSDTKYFLSHHMRGFSFCAQILNFSYFSKYQKYVHIGIFLSSLLPNSFLENGLLFELMCVRKYPQHPCIASLIKYSILYVSDYLTFPLSEFIIKTFLWKIMKW